jgi:hypothetical protein
VRQLLEGKKVLDVPDEFFEYRLARLFGWTKAQIDETPAHWSDWALAIADTEAAVRRG